LTRLVVMFSDFLKIPFVIKKTFVILKSEILGTD
jgi:hypothetical protein